MREILFRAKFGNDWKYGYLSVEPKGLVIKEPYSLNQSHIWHINPETVGQYTGLTDKNGNKIFEGDIVQYRTDDGFIFISVVKLGEYKQDGSNGEYNGTDCIGYYVEVIKFICPDWYNPDWGNGELDFFHEHLKTQNILEVAKKCKVIGNIHDNSDLIKQEG